MVYGPKGEVVSGGYAAEATRKLLQLAWSKMLLGSFKEPYLQEMARINDLRRSCGVEPEPKPKTITFRRYGGKE